MAPNHAVKYAMRNGKPFTVTDTQYVTAAMLNVYTKAIRIIHKQP